jgi:hypothetical protein
MSHSYTTTISILAALSSANTPNGRVARLLNNPVHPCRRNFTDRIKGWRSFFVKLSWPLLHRFKVEKFSCAMFELVNVKLFQSPIVVFGVVRRCRFRRQDSFSSVELQKYVFQYFINSLVKENTVSVILSCTLCHGIFVCHWSDAKLRLRLGLNYGSNWRSCLQRFTSVLALLNSEIPSLSPLNDEDNLLVRVEVENVMLACGWHNGQEGMGEEAEVWAHQN